MKSALRVNVVFSGTYVLSVTCKPAITNIQLLHISELSQCVVYLVTPVYCDKTAEPKITRFWLSGSSMLQYFSWYVGRQNLKENFLIWEIFVSSTFSHKKIVSYMPPAVQHSVTERSLSPLHAPGTLFHTQCHLHPHFQPSDGFKRYVVCLNLMVQCPWSGCTWQSHFNLVVSDK